MDIKLSFDMKHAPSAVLSSLLGRAIGSPFEPDVLLDGLTDDESAVLVEVERSTAFRRSRISHDHGHRMLLVRALSDALAFQSRNSPAGRDAAMRLSVSGDRPVSSYEVRWDDLPVATLGSELTKQDVIGVLENPRFVAHTISSPDNSGQRLGVRFSIGSVPVLGDDTLLIVHSRYLKGVLTVKAQWRVRSSLVAEEQDALGIVRRFLYTYGIETRYSGSDTPHLLAWDIIVPQGARDLARGPDYISPTIGPMDRPTDAISLTEARSTSLGYAVIVVGYTIDILNYTSDRTLFPVPLDYEKLRELGKKLRG